MIYDDSHCDTYEEYSKEILAYMRSQDESFDFGEGLIGMTDGGEYGMYKIAILPYLNSFYETDFEIRWKAQQVDKLHHQIEAKFDGLSNEKLNHRLYNLYDKKMKWRSKRAYIAKYERHSHVNYPYITKFDENGNEYVARCNIDNKKYKTWDKKKRKKPIARSYLSVCCDNIIGIEYDECDKCYRFHDIDGIFNFGYWEDSCFWMNNDFSEYEVKEGHWRFHGYNDEEEARWNILHMK